VLRTSLALVLAVGSISAAAQQNLPPVQYDERGVPTCPSDLDLRNLDVRLSATVRRPENEASVRQEQRLAIHCRMAGSRYTEKDWERLRAVLRGER